MASEIRAGLENKPGRITLLFGGTRVMNQVLPKGATKGSMTTLMMNTETSETAAVAAPGATAAPEKAAAKKAATRKKGAPKGQKTARGGKPSKQAKTEKKSAQTTTPRRESKGGKILEM